MYNLSSSSPSFYSYLGNPSSKIFLSNHCFFLSQVEHLEVFFYFNCESPLHYITQCEGYSSFRLIMLNKVKQFIPNIHLLILVHGYDPDNDELVRYNTKILIASQDFIYDTKRFCDKNKPSVPPPAPLPAPPPAPLPDPPHAPLPAPPI